MTGSYWESAFFNRHAGPCALLNVPNCLYLPNGVHPHPHLSYVPFAFIRCYANRLVEEGKCTVDSVWGTQTYPYNGTCTQRFAIPPQRRPIDSYLTVLRSQTGTTSSERDHAMLTTNARAGELQRWNAQSTPFLASLDARARQTWLVTVLDEIKVIWIVFGP